METEMENGGLGEELEKELMGRILKDKETTPLNKKPRSLKARTVFLKEINTYQYLLNRGFSNHAIWEIACEKNMFFWSYILFNRLVRELILHKQPVKRDQKKEINEEIENLKNDEEAKINQENKENKIKEELNNGIVSDDFKEMYIGKGKQSKDPSKDEYNFEVN